jgi:twitching motility protein PilT
MPLPNLSDLLRYAVELGASDLHIATGVPPALRLDGTLRPVGEDVLSADDTRTLVLGLLTDQQRARLEQDWELDFAVQIQGVGRFRGNAHFSRGAVEAAFRHIPETIPELSTLGHRPSIRRATELKGGLVLVTGVTGSGKSTTMAALVNTICQERTAMIITVEDPVEYIFRSAGSIIKQREVGTDTHSFPEALRHVLRQDPDVILIGEMRDLETIRTAITAAETGHLVFATLHTIDAPKAIDRIVDAFPGDQQSQVLAQLANALEMVISQRLLPTESGTGRALASEILVANTPVRACIRDRRFEQLIGLIEIGARDGMHTIDDSLSDLFLSGQISKDTAVAHARDRNRIGLLERTPPPKAKRGLFG